LPVGDEPAAEMWFGAHPAAPSSVEDGRGLDELIAESPVSVLGLRTVDGFGARLPFLMKLLAAAEPLSLQVHPTRERARARFAEQDAAGIPLDAPERSYQDASHKPELIYALTRFEGMAGFRDAARTATILRMLGLAWLDEIAEQLATTASPAETLRDVVTEVLSWSGPSCTSGCRSSARRRRRPRRRRTALASASDRRPSSRATSNGRASGSSPRRHLLWTGTPLTRGSS
jgi:mannose-6-phosphate isomerase